MKQNLIKTKKSVFFARLKRWAACLWPPRGRRQILRLSLLKKQGLSSTLSRAKTVLIRVEKTISVTSVASVANKKSVKICVNPWLKNLSIKNIKLCKTNPIFIYPRWIPNALTLALTMTNNNEQRTANYSKQSQNKPNQTHLSVPGWPIYWHYPLHQFAFLIIEN